MPLSLPAKDVTLLAQEAMEAWLQGRSYCVPRWLPPEFTSHRAGAFVTLVQNGKLRACWGTLEPQHANLAEEIVAAARGVCTRDTRFPPIRPQELPKLRLIVSIVLSPPQPAREWQIRPLEHGVLVRRGARSAVVLPHEGRTVRRMLTLARQKAGISAREPMEVFVFRVLTITE